ncbi:hypothetical protein NUW54_g9387 [Trametes sanguinea]|uniref:Uncharacterized protein n=1 Tax=Trametes sanguinea TaxID=158606 RepID=A0ACC1P6F6_9APHY|nr:hypothetical protein NUW54_g9387 [Trametes sanguinea]
MRPSVPNRPPPAEEDDPWLARSPRVTEEEVLSAWYRNASVLPRRTRMRLVLKTFGCSVKYYATLQESITVFLHGRDEPANPTSSPRQSLTAPIPGCPRVPHREIPFGATDGALPPELTSGFVSVLYPKLAVWPEDVFQRRLHLAKVRGLEGFIALMAVANYMNAAWRYHHSEASSQSVDVCTPESFGWNIAILLYPSYRIQMPAKHECLARATLLMPERREELRDNHPDGDLALDLCDVVYRLFERPLETIAQNKKVLFEKPKEFELSVLCHVRPYFDPLKPLLRRWLQLLLLVYKFEGHGYYGIHGFVIRLLEETLRNLQENASPGDAQHVHDARKKREDFVREVTHLTTRIDVRMHAQEPYEHKFDVPSSPSSPLPPLKKVRKQECLADFDLAGRPLPPLVERKIELGVTDDSKGLILPPFSYAVRPQGVNDAVVELALRYVKFRVPKEDNLDDQMFFVRKYVGAALQYCRELGLAPPSNHLYTPEVLGWNDSLRPTTSLGTIQPSPRPRGLASGTPGPYTRAKLLNTERVWIDLDGLQFLPPSPVIHDGIHDIESMFWILLYVCMTHSGPGGERRKELIGEPSDEPGQEDVYELRRIIFCFFHGDLKTVAWKSSRRVHSSSLWFEGYEYHNPHDLVIKLMEKILEESLPPSKASDDVERKQDVKEQTNNPQAVLQATPEHLGGPASLTQPALPPSSLGDFRITTTPDSLPESNIGLEHPPEYSDHAPHAEFVPASLFPMYYTIFGDCQEDGALRGTLEARVLRLVYPHVQKLELLLRVRWERLLLANEFGGDEYHSNHAFVVHLLELAFNNIGDRGDAPTSPSLSPPLDSFKIKPSYRSYAQRHASYTHGIRTVVVYSPASTICRPSPLM